MQWKILVDPEAAFPGPTLDTNLETSFATRFDSRLHCSTKKFAFKRDFYNKKEFLNYSNFDIINNADCYDF
jgi:hypothetical protein